MVKRLFSFSKILPFLNLAIVNVFFPCKGCHGFEFQRKQQCLAEVCQLLALLSVQWKVVLSKCTAQQKYYDATDDFGPLQSCRPHMRLRAPQGSDPSRVTANAITQN